MATAAPVTFNTRIDPDRWAFPAFIALIWFGILMGFVPEIAQRFAAPHTPYPAIVYVHAVAYVGWLALLTAPVATIALREKASERFSFKERARDL